MKFFQVFRSCCRPTAHNSASVIPQENVTTPTTITKLRQSKIKSGSASNWRPKLSSISEDRVLASASQRDEGQRCVKKNSCKDRSTAKSNSYKYSHHDDYGSNNAMGLMIPAFSPTPFMF